jgi:hypothetical protein
VTTKLWYSRKATQNQTASASRGARLSHLVNTSLAINVTSCAGMRIAAAAAWTGPPFLAQKVKTHNSFPSSRRAFANIIFFGSAFDGTGHLRQRSSSQSSRRFRTHCPLQLRMIRYPRDASCRPRCNLHHLRRRGGRSESVIPRCRAGTSPSCSYALGNCHAS